MIEINLLPEDLRKKESVKITLPEIPIKKTLFVAGGVVISLQLLLTLYIVFLHFQFVALNGQITVLREANKEVLEVKIQTTGVLNRLKEARNATTRPFYWASLLNEISGCMTKGVWLRNLSVSEEEPRSTGAADKKAEAPAASTDGKKPAKARFLVLEGSAVGQGQETAFIGKFLKQLKDSKLLSDLFYEIKPYNINQRRLKDFDVYDFMIYLRFRKEKA